MHQASTHAMPAPGMSRIRALLALVAASMLALVMTAPTAFAHDVLIDSSPADGAEIEDVPEQIELTFSNTLTDGTGVTNLIQVTDADGQQWEMGDTAVDGEHVRVDLCPQLPQGEYTIVYRVVYNDGHVGEDQLTFTNVSTDSPESGDPADCGAVEDASSPSPTADTESPAAVAGDDAAAADESGAPQAELNEQSSIEPADEATPETEATSDSDMSLGLWILIIAGIVVALLAVYFIVRGSRGSKAGTVEVDENTTN